MFVRSLGLGPMTLACGYSCNLRLIVIRGLDSIRLTFKTFVCGYQIITFPCVVYRPSVLEVVTDGFLKKYQMLPEKNATISKSKSRTTTINRFISKVYHILSSEILE